MIKKIFFIILYFSSPLIPILVLYTSTPLKYNNISFLISMILGATAYTWLTFEFILGSRPKFIEAAFGLDKFYRFHGIMAIVSVLLVLIHRTILEDLFRGGIAKQYGDFAMLIFIGIVIFSILFMVDWITGKIKLILRIKKYLQQIKVLKFEYQIFIHNLTTIGLVIMLIHVMLTSSAQRFIQVELVYIIYFVIGLSFYIYHKFISKTVINKENEFIVKEIYQESPSMWTMKLVSKQNAIFDYKPGQFGFLKIRGNNIPFEEHPFSLSSSPANKEYVSFTIKQLGDFTSQIKNVELGYKAYIDAPYGKFCYRNHPLESDIVLIGGGVGITPLLSMLRYMRSSDKKKNVILLWGVNNQSELICMNEFDEMQNEMMNFRFIPVLSRDESWKGERGHIDKHKIERAASHLRKDTDSIGYYICGPAPMMTSTVNSLKALGVKSRNIHFEKFSM